MGLWLLGLAWGAEHAIHPEKILMVPFAELRRDVDDRQVADQWSKSFAKALRGVGHQTVWSSDAPPVGHVALDWADLQQRAREEGFDRVVHGVVSGKGRYVVVDLIVVGSTDARPWMGSVAPGSGEDQVWVDALAPGTPGHGVFVTGTVKPGALVKVAPGVTVAELPEPPPLPGSAPAIPVAPPIPVVAPVRVVSPVPVLPPALPPSPGMPGPPPPVPVAGLPEPLPPVSALPKVGE